MNALTTLQELAPAELAAPDALWRELEDAHAQPPRHYHTIDHVVEVARHHAEVAADPGWRQPVETFLAVLYHDAIYVAGRMDNEQRSAELARESIARHLSGGVDADRVEELILLTARHGSLAGDKLDADAALFVDCDMAILAADDETFAAYERGVAAEYTAVIPADAYKAGRRAFLSSLLAKERIFASDAFHTRLDARARANIAASIAAL